MNESYNKGLNDAWKYAGKIIDIWFNCVHCDPNEFNRRFKLDGKLNDDVFRLFFAKYSAKEAIEMYKLCDRNINVGDEVVYHSKSEPMVILQITHDPRDGGYFFNAMYQDGTMNIDGNLALVTKTGRHFPQITDMLKEMEDRK